MADLDTHDTRIVVRTRVLPINYLIIRPFCKPIVTLDGVEHVRPWGRHTFEVAPGQHTVDVAFVALWITGSRAISVDVPAHETIKVTYWTPLSPFGQGRIRAPKGSPIVSRGLSTTRPSAEPALVGQTGGPGIVVHSWHSPTNPLVEISSVSVQIDGEIRKVKWGDTFFAVPPGRHEVQIWCRWFWHKLGLSSITIEVAPEKVAQAVWKVPGSIRHNGEIWQSA